MFRRPRPRAIAEPSGGWNGKPLNGYFAWCTISWALSLAGCPVVTIPCGIDHAGMPFGTQISLYWDVPTRLIKALLLDGHALLEIA